MRVTSFGQPFRQSLFRAVLAVLLVSLQASAFAAIALFTVPNGLDGVEGDSASSLPFGDSAACTNGFRYQQVFDGDQGFFGTIGEIAFRLNGGQAGVGPLTYGNATITLSSTDRTAATLSSDFDENVGLDRQVVWSGDLILESTSIAMGTKPFELVVVDGGGFQFGDEGDNLLLDVTVEDCPPGAAFFMDSVTGTDATRGLFASDRNSDTGSFSQGLVAQVIASTPPPVAPLYDCPLADGGDNLTRGFYLENFPTNQLGRVQLTYYPSTAGNYRIELTARQGAFDGAVVGSHDVAFQVTSPGDPVSVWYDFRNAPVAVGSTVTFAQRIVSQPASSSIFFDIGDGPCADVVETSGTTAPLSTVRRDSVGLTVIPSSPDTRPLGLGGNWTIVDRSAEGFMIDVTDRNQLVAIWFTYDDDGSQQWLLGTAQSFDDSGVGMDLFRFDGPTFLQIRQAGFNNALIGATPWGRMYIRFNGCDTGTVAYESTLGFGAGEFDIERSYATEDNVCQ